MLRGLSEWPGSLYLLPWTFLPIQTANHSPTYGLPWGYPLEWKRPREKIPTENLTCTTLLWQLLQPNVLVLHSFGSHWWGWEGDLAAWASQGLHLHLCTNQSKQSKACKTAVINNKVLKWQIFRKLLSSGLLRERDYNFFWQGKQPSETREYGVGFAVKNTIVGATVPPIGWLSKNLNSLPEYYYETCSPCECICANTWHPPRNKGQF